MTSETTNTFPPEVRERAVRMMLDHEALHPSRCATILSIAAKIGCTRISPLGRRPNRMGKRRLGDFARLAHVAAPVPK